MRRAIATGALAAALVWPMAVPAGAGAATVALGSDGRVSFVAVAGERNVVAARVSGSSLVLTASAGALVDVDGETGCVVAGSTATCAGATSVAAQLGDGDDIWVSSTGDDTVSGGTGIDTVSFATHTATVFANLDGDGHSGAIGEQDLIRADVENLTGGAGGDVLRGNGRANRLLGGPGRDMLLGGGGPDVVRGGSGPDMLSGDGGADRLFGDAGRDRLIGNSGRDRLFGGSGDDYLDAQDRRSGDRVTGGSGRDYAHVNRGDTVRSCESVGRRA